MRKIVWMFSGQGSQYFNMGRGLYETDPVFRDTMNQCDEVAGRLGSESLLRVLFHSEARDRFADTWIAARNARQHFVLSGLPAAIDRVAQRLHDRDILHQRLPVAVVFHSPLLDPVERIFREKMEAVAPKELGYPLISAAYLTQLTRLPSGFFWEVARRPVRFQETISWLEGRGGADYIDLGPFGTLASFLKHGLDPATHSRAFPLMTPFHGTQDTLRRIESVIQEVCRAERG